MYKTGRADTSTETLPLRQVARHESTRQTIHVGLRSPRTQLRRRHEAVSDHCPLQVSR